MKATVRRAILRFRRPLIVIVQLALVAATNWTAFALRFDGVLPGWAFDAWVTMLPWLVGIRAITFFPFRLYEGLWRYSSIYDLRNIVLGVGVSSVAFYGVARWSPVAPRTYPRSIFIVDALLLILALGGLRLARRFFRELHQPEASKRVLVYGAGDAGELIVRDMKNNAFYDYAPVGFIDDDRSKAGLRIHGVPVRGTRDDLPRVIRETQPHEILMAMPRTEPQAIREIVRVLEPFRIRITTLPNLRDILNGRVEVAHIRSLEPEDLLNRAPIGLASAPVRQMVQGRRVMVTGAGGSIGSELCRQIAALGPATLVLFERYENSLYAVANDLNDRRHGARAVAVVGDVTDRARLDDVLTTYRPEIVFHAAAHKHVPLMELNPCEAVKNNVTGTRILAEAAERHGVDRFIFISTDKAVNPTSVMGASKRVAELVVHAQAQGSGTSFFTVRFGNVLGSNGSVVPRFLDQIKAGGPVTITHPEMRRFFMLIPEAVQLVLHAAAQGESGETYVLEMGEQVKLVDMARNLIRLSGYRPEEDIPITFIGLRPGEKLYEELIGENETVEPSRIDKIMRVHARMVPTPESLQGAVARLEALAREERRTELLAEFATIIPEFATEHPVAATRPSLAYSQAEPDADAEPDASAAAFAMTCPTCQSRDVHRSRARSIAERMKKTMTDERLFRCYKCGWRGWLMPVVAAPPPVAAQAAGAPDLGSIDAAIDGVPAPLAPAFSPRNLK